MKSATARVRKRCEQNNPPLTVEGAEMRYQKVTVHEEREESHQQDQLNQKRTGGILFNAITL